MSELLEESKDLFNELGLSVAKGEVEVGSTYPIFGMITKILDDSDPKAIIAEINYNIRATMSVKDPSKISLLKERAFESGIFVSKVTAKNPVEVVCQTVIFGRKQGFNA